MPHILPWYWYVFSILLSQSLRASLVAIYCWIGLNVVPSVCCFSPTESNMSSFVGVLVSDPWLQSQFTQVELQTLKSKKGLNQDVLLSEIFDLFLRN
ncbi:uncharacterized protein [Glycine max]|uniref:uncharacterized protein isoform X1 n=1 Tax=Glycine max TaxID=3847 RepID=UPI001B355361|nr:uncharacterized protein LOC100778994 isoform X1 [Glycine max]